MATLRSMRRLCGRWRRRGYITNRRPRFPSSCAAVTITINQRACLPSGLSFIANPRWLHTLTLARWRSEYAGVMHRPSALVQFQGRAYKFQCCPNLWSGVGRISLAPETEKPPRCDLSEIRSGVLIANVRSCPMTDKLLQCRECPLCATKQTSRFWFEIAKVTAD
jgi:hypothetical protein